MYCGDCSPLRELLDVWPLQDKRGRDDSPGQSGLTAQIVQERVCDDCVGTIRVRAAAAARQANQSAAPPQSAHPLQRGTGPAHARYNSEDGQQQSRGRAGSVPVAGVCGSQPASVSSFLSPASLYSKVSYLGGIVPALSSAAGRARMSHFTPSAATSTSDTRLTFAQDHSGNIKAQAAGQEDVETEA